MNFFEQQLRNIIGDSDNCKYIGRACYIILDADTRIKASFISTHISEQYDALLLEVLNRENGCVDKLKLRFADYFTRSSQYGICPYLWENEGKTIWYATPSGRELAALSEAVDEYIDCFSAEQEQMQYKEMEM